jgi:hypothetical protein
MKFKIIEKDNGYHMVANPENAIDESILLGSNSREFPLTIDEKLYSKIEKDNLANTEIGWSDYMYFCRGGYAFITDQLSTDIINLNMFEKYLESRVSGHIKIRKVKGKGLRLCTEDEIILYNVHSFVYSRLFFPIMFNLDSLEHPMNQVIREINMLMRKAKLENLKSL